MTNHLEKFEKELNNAVGWGRIDPQTKEWVLNEFIQMQKKQTPTPAIPLTKADALEQGDYVTLLNLAYEEGLTKNELLAVRDYIRDLQSSNQFRKEGIEFWSNQVIQLIAPSSAEKMELPLKGVTLSLLKETIEDLNEIVEIVGDFYTELNGRLHPALKPFAGNIQVLHKVAVERVKKLTSHLSLPLEGADEQ